MRNKKIIPLLLVFYILIVNINIYSQNYIEYQKQITIAENYMFDSLFTESVSQYRKTFDSYEFNFPRDCIIASQVASYIDDDTSAFYFLNKAVRFGAHIDRIKMIPLLQKLESIPLWEQFLYDYEIQRKIYHKNINWEYRNLCNIYTKKDLYLNKKDQSFFANRYFVWRFGIRKKLYNNCIEGIKMVDSLMPINGFPSYKTIGVVDSTTPPLANSTLSGFQILALYFHYPLHKELDFNEYSKKLFEQVELGNLSARDYALLSELYYRGTKDYKEGDALYYIRWVVMPKKDYVYENGGIVNKSRANLGLSNCYYEQKRKYWQHRYNMNIKDSFELFYYEF